MEYNNRHSTQYHTAESESQASTINSTQNEKDNSLTLIGSPHNFLIHQSPISNVPAETRNTICIENIMSTVDLGCSLDLDIININTRNTEYRPSRYPGLTMRIREPRCTGLIFRSGKLNCVGARSEYDSKLGARKMARIIQRLGYPVHFSNFKCHNFLATMDLRFPIRLEDLYNMHHQFSSYEPELFPGLTYRMVTPRVVLLIFVNGKIVFTGAKSPNDIYVALDKMYDTLLSFKKK